MDPARLNRVVFFQPSYPPFKPAVQEPSNGNIAASDTAIPIYSSPPAFRIPEPVVIGKNHRSYFSDMDTPKCTLIKIDDLWRESELFKRVHEPESNFYTNYLCELASAVKRHHKYLADLEKVINTNGLTPFEKEFIELTKRGDLTGLQKSVCLTQAFELALLGIIPTPVLITINSIRDNHLNERENKPNKKPNGENSKGYRQELQAGWFLAKFIYQLESSNSNANNFIHSIILNGVKRTKRRKEDKVGEVFQREIDIFTEDALVSVKTRDNKFYEQIRDLFFILLDDKIFNLRDRIEKIILIKCAEEPKQFLPSHMDTRDYSKLKEEVLDQSRISIEQYSALPGEDEKIFRQLISKHGIDIYFIPSVNDPQAIEKWIKHRYEYLDVNNREALTA